MIADKNRIYDGWTQLEAGVDAGREPNLIDPNQVVSAENMIFRGGFPTPRPGWRKLTEDFTNPGHGCDGHGVHIPDSPPYPVDPNFRSDHIYRTGYFQCALGYSPHGSDDCLMALIGGRLYKIVPHVNSCTVTEVVPDDPNSPYLYTAAPFPYMITTATPGTHTFVISGSHASEFPNSTIATVTDSPHNDGIYTVVSATNYEGNTLIVVSEVIPSSTIGGTIKGALISFFPNPSGTPQPYRNFSTSSIAYMVQADKWFVAQDGIGKAIIYDGKKARRSNLETTRDKLEIPTGTMMAYGNGRIVVVVNERDIAFGDLYGSHLDTQTDPADSIILFTERTFLSGGFDAAIPFQQGVATGIQFFPQLDTSTGNGQLLVFAERGAASFNTAIDRTLWQTSAFQILALISTGCRGHRSIAPVNEDLWFRGEDGYRAFRQARSDSWGWAHLPLSTNVSQFLDLDTGRLLKFASSLYFDNRVIGTTSPAWNNGRVFHGGMVAVDFNILSSFGTKYKPTWEGHWTIGTERTSNLPDIKVSQVVTGLFNGVTRAFAFGLDTETGFNQLYELSFDDKDDFNGQFPWEFVSRALDFKGGGQGGQSNPFTENELYDGDIWISDVSQGGVTPGVPYA